jgi:uncharacterized protein YgbK (DUF1537 family)
MAIDISHSAIGALYTSGGDVTMEVMKILEVEGIDIKDEVIPLAVYGRFIGGKYNKYASYYKRWTYRRRKNTSSLCRLSIN